MSKKPSASYERLRTALVVREATRKSMQGNRAEDTAPEIRLSKALWSAGLRGYRKNVKSLPGKPDIVFNRAKLAIFVHGCYWHGCPTCTRNRTPKTNARYWAAKFAMNKERDARNQADLEALSYRVLVLWECEVTEKRIEAAVDNIARALDPPGAAIIQSP